LISNPAPARKTIPNCQVIILAAPVKSSAMTPLTTGTAWGGIAAGGGIRTLSSVGSGLEIYQARIPPVAPDASSEQPAHCISCSRERTTRARAKIETTKGRIQISESACLA